MSINQPSPLNLSKDNKENNKELSLKEIEVLFSPDHIDRPHESNFKKIIQSLQNLSQSDYRSKLESIAKDPKFHTLKQIFLSAFLATILTVANYSDLQPSQNQLKQHPKPPKVHNRKDQSDINAHRPTEIKEELSLANELNSCTDVASVYKIVKNLKNKDGDSPYISFNMDASFYNKGNDYFDKNGKLIELVATNKVFDRGVDIAVDPESIPYGSLVFIEYHDYRNLDLLEPVVKIKPIPGHKFDHIQSYLDYVVNNTKEKITVEIKGSKIFLGGHEASDTGSIDYIKDDGINDCEKRSIDISYGTRSDQSEAEAISLGLLPKNCIPKDMDYFRQRMLAKFYDKYDTKIPPDRIEIVIDSEMIVVVILPGTLKPETEELIYDNTRLGKDKLEETMLEHAQSEE
jgi:hypothetical protein